jgi:hypothetical protein
MLRNLKKTLRKLMLMLKMMRKLKKTQPWKRLTNKLMILRWEVKSNSEMSKKGSSNRRKNRRMSMKVAETMNTMMVVTKIRKTKSQLKNHKLKNRLTERKSPPRLI